MFRQFGNLDSAILNEQGAAIDMLDSLWVDAGIATTPGSAVSGLTTPLVVGPTGFNCTSVAGFNWWIATGMAWGTIKSDMEGYGEAYGLPYWSFTAAGATLSDSAQRTVYPTGGGTVEECSTGPDQPVAYRDYYNTYGFVAAEDFKFDVAPYGELSAPSVPAWWTWVGDQFFGCVPSLNVELSLEGVTAAFRVEGLAIRMPAAFRSMPEGTTILEAKARVRVGGLAAVSWSADVTIGPYDHKESVPTADYRSWSYSEGGVPIRQYEEDEGTPTTDYTNPSPPLPDEGATVGFRLVGRRLKSRTIQLADGTFATVQDATYRSYGAALSVGALDADEWGLVDFKGVLQDLLDEGRLGEEVEFELWPTISGLDPDESEADLASFLRAQFGARSASVITGGPGRWGYSLSATGAFVSYDSLEIGTVLYRYRLPSGAVGEWVLPVFQPRVSGPDA